MDDLTNQMVALFPLNDDVCIIVEPIFDCFVKVSQAGFIVADLLFEISDSRNSHPGNDISLLGKYPEAHETPDSMGNTQPSSQLCLTKTSIVIIPTPVIKGKIEIF